MLSAGAGQAAGRTSLIWGLSKAGDDAYRMRMGARLPSNTGFSFGAEFGFKGNEEDKGALARGNRLPNPALWTSLTTPKSFHFLGIEQASISFRHEPEKRIGRVGLSAQRAWLFFWGVRGSVRDQLTLPYNLENPAAARWRLENRIQIDAERIGSALALTSWQRKDDPVRHLAIKATQSLPGGLNLTATIEDVTSLRPRHTLRAEQRLFGGLRLTASSTNFLHDRPTHSITARYTARW